MHRRTLYPMPIAGLIDHADAMSLPAAGFGMLTRLCLHYWQTGCRPLPKADHELRSIARAHLPTWRRSKAIIIRVFEAIRPELERYYEGREAKRTTIQMVGARGSAVAAAKRRQERIEKTQRAIPTEVFMVPKRLERDPNSGGPAAKSKLERGEFTD